MLTRLISPAVLLGSFLLLAMSPPQKHPVEGDWYSDGNKSKITIVPCGDKYCGKITWLKDPASATKETGVGTPIVKDFEIVNEQTMEKGKIHDPRNGKWYNGRLKVGSDGRLEMRGWLGLPALGKSAYWTRAN